MKLAYFVLFAVCLINVNATRLIFDKRLNREFNLCGPQLFVLLGRICGTQRYDPESSYTQAQDTQKPSISAMCCEKKCKVMEVITAYCPNKRFPGGPVRPNTAEVLPQKTTTPTEKTTTPTEKTTTTSWISVAKMTTTTEKLASIWFLTG